MRAAKQPVTRGRLVWCLLLFPFLAYLSFAQTIAMVVENRNPIQAISLAPWDGAVRATLSKKMFREELSRNGQDLGRPSEAATQMALEAYLDEPLAPSALAALGASTSSARRSEFWTLSSKISRREPILQGYLLDYYANSQDLEGSIRVLNQILQVRAEQRSELLGTLVVALRDPGSIELFIDVLRANPDWADSFIIAASRDEAALENLAVLLRQIPAKVTDSSTDKALVLAFAKAGRLESAYEIYKPLVQERQKVERAWNSELPPFDWVLADRSGFRAQRERDSSDLGISIARGSGGAIASRILPVPRGLLKVQGKYEIRPAQQAEELEITISCLANATVIARSDFATGEISLSARVPDTCEYVGIQLLGRAWSDGEAITGKISPLEISIAD